MYNLAHWHVVDTTKKNWKGDKITLKELSK